MSALLCCTCKATIVLTTEQERILRETEQLFYCLWGHSQHFPRGQSTEDKLRQERDNLKQQIARVEQEKAAEVARRESAERTAATMTIEATKVRKRHAAGLCPCCNRSFAQLRNHMKNKHPNFQAEVVQ